MDQTFTGPVGQVAGGDIHNHGEVPYEAWPTDALQKRRQEHRSLIWAARRRLFFNMPLTILILSVLGLTVYQLQMLGLAFDGNLGRIASEPPAWLFFVAIAGVSIPILLVFRIRQREGAIILDSKKHLLGIDIALNKRGLR